MARCLMVQGTASGVGKSLLATALCRLLAQDGYRVAPFKAWNMSLNAFVTADGAEIGRAQGMQAEAAGVPARSDFNPILVKPKGGMTAQVIQNGRPYGDFTGFASPDFVQLGHETAAAALARLKAEFDWIVIEGAGSPAEPNLRDRDLANMAIAEIADAPVLLVADMDRGGAFAALVGTLELLEPRQRERVAGLVLNRYHGPKEILLPGIREIETRTGKPVTGVLPYQSDLYWEEEDSVYLQSPTPRGSAEVTVAVIRFPHMANFTDVAPLAAEPDVAVRYVDAPGQLAGADLVLLPGSKNTLADLRWLRERGLADAIVAYAGAKGATIGVCGGYQMLGARLEDPDGLEDAPGTTEGLGLLPVVTRFAPGKRTTRTEVAGLTGLLGAWSRGQRLTGYEIHSGQTTLLPGARPAFRVTARGGAPAPDDATDGCTEKGGWTFGTYLHGLFDNDQFRRNYLNALRARRGLAPLAPGTPAAVRRERTYNRLAQAVREHLDLTEVTLRRQPYSGNAFQR